MGIKKDETLHEFQSKIMPVFSSKHPFPQELHAAVQALQQVQGDYSHAMKQLEEVYDSFGEREKIAGERLRYFIDNFAAILGEKDDSLTAKKEAYGIPESLLQPAPTSIRAYCFGSFEVYLNWNKLEKWSSLKAKSLLKFLLNRRKKSVVKDVLIEALWPNCDFEVGNDNLKNAVYALRQTLSRSELSGDNKANSPYVLFSEGRYLIAPDLEVWLDTEEFEQRWLTGRRLEKEGKVEDAVKYYGLAEELYRGDYLEDEPYAEWTLVQREALKDIYFAILGKLAGFSFQAADYENCVMYCQKILANDPCHEEAYRWLIRCYTRMGQRHRARQWYNLCVTTLKRELDDVPDCETTNLFHKLLNQEPI